jgi:hypothetical protein
MVNPTVPDIVPAKLLAVLLLRVKTAAVLLSVMVPRVFPPLSVILATVWALPLRSNVEPEPYTVSVVPVGSAFVVPICKTPPLIVVVPV